MYSKKQVLYFSDGVLEVENNENELPPTGFEMKNSPVNPQELTWFPWILHHTVTAGIKALEVCDYVGESLAAFFGITTPKYQFEINEYHRCKKLEEENQSDVEMGNWSKNDKFLEQSNEKIVTESTSSDCKNNINNCISSS